MIFSNINKYQGFTNCLGIVYFPMVAPLLYFQVVGLTYNEVNEEKVTEYKFYETIYALLDDISPEYRNAFGDALMQKLSQLKENSE